MRVISLNLTPETRELIIIIKIIRVFVCQLTEGPFPSSHAHNCTVPFINNVRILRLNYLFILIEQ